MELNLRIKKYLPLFFIAVAFASPMLLANLAFIFQKQIKQSTNSYGNLLATAEHLKITKFENLLPNEKPGGQKWRLVFVEPLECHQLCQAQKQALIQLHALLRDDQKRVEVLSALQQDIIPHKNDGQVLVIDPQGNHMMYYDHNAQPNGILKDLMRLLKYSNV